MSESEAHLRYACSLPHTRRRRLLPLPMIDLRHCSAYMLFFTLSPITPSFVADLVLSERDEHSTPAQRESDRRKLIKKDFYELSRVVDEDFLWPFETVFFLYCVVNWPERSTVRFFLLQF
jgi:hypothetical protein